MFDDQRIFMTRVNGGNWSPQQEAPVGGTSTVPALASFSSRVYMAWKGVFTDQRIFYRLRT